MSSTDRSMRTPMLATCAMLTLTANPQVHAAEGNAVERIQQYCSASWRNARISRQDWQDCSQAVLSELLERISTERMGHAIEDSDSAERRELNRAIWRVAKRWRRARRNLPLTEADDLTRYQNEEQSFNDAIAEMRELVASPQSSLTERQRQIIERSLDGNSVADIAEELSIPASRVSHDKYRAIRKLRAELVS